VPQVRRSANPAKSSLGPKPKQNEANAVGLDLLQKKDTEIARLRALVAKRELELTNLRKEVHAARQCLAIHETMIATMRHIKAPPGERQ
jgi:hypothetical protein